MAAEETALRKLIREFLDKQNVFYWHNLNVALKRRYKPYPGLPDLEGIYHGNDKHFYIETKGEDKRRKPSQVEFAENVYKHSHGKEAVILALDWESFLKQWHKFTH